ncbi:MAG: acyl carrier protein, partial [Candidatus Saccharimonas sp.]|nr:acyl carrier protein [Planctomycetaceae bacterium]
NAATASCSHDVAFKAVVESLRKLAGKEIEIGADSNLVALLREIGDSLELFDLVMEIEDGLDIVLSEEEISQFFWPKASGSPRSFEQWEREVAPSLTVAAFVDFIHQRMQPISFEPVSVLGSPPCPAAGYFVGMSELVEQVQPNAERFGPSTPITSVMPSRQLPTFWWRLSRAAGRTLPPLSFWLNRLANVLLIVSAACLAFGVLTDWAFLAAVWLLCLKGILFGRWLHRRANPLPRGIVTFGDLSRHLAGQREIPSPKPFARDIDVWVRRKLLRWPAPESPSEGNND